MDPLVARIKEELKTSAEEDTKKSAQRFFKEPVTIYGVKTATVRKIAEKYWSPVKALSKTEIFKLCEELFSSSYTEEAFVAAFWLPNLMDKLELGDLPTFKTWIQKYISNWAECDSFCNHTIGGLLEKYPEGVSEVKNWAKSKNRWLKRAAAVSLIIPAKKGCFLQDVFEISDLLMHDEDDMVQKGYGWLLKAASKKHPEEVLNYVMKNSETMPRTPYRYAIELLPKELKAQAMKKPSAKF